MDFSPDSPASATIPDVTDPRLQALVRRMAVRTAWNPTDVDDLCQSALLEIYLAVRKGGVIVRPWGWARRVAWRAMVAYYYDSSRNRLLEGRGQEGPRTSTSQDHWASEDLFFAGYLSALEEALGPECREVAENLLLPGEDFSAWILAEVDRKRAWKETDPSLDLRGLERVRISQRQLREALGLPVGHWHRILRKIRLWTYSWLQAQDLPLPSRSPATT